MLTKAEAEARVADGAAHLDQAVPGWFHRVDVGTLTLSNCQRCVMGQLSGLKERYDGDEAPFIEGLVQVQLIEEGECQRVNAIARAHGMAVNGDDASALDGDSGAAFALLQDAWIAAIAARKYPDQQRESQSKPVAVPVGE